MKLRKTILGALAAGTLFTGVAQADFVPVSSIADIRKDSLAVITTDKRLTKDQVWILDRLIFVANDAVLTIEPGTILRGEGLSGTPDTDPDPGALVVSRGSQVIANGAPWEPIIFTTLEDPFVPAVPSMGPTSADTIPTDSQIDRTPDVAMPGQGYSPGGAPDDNGFAYEEVWGGVVLTGFIRTGFNNLSGDAWQSFDDDPTVVGGDATGNGAKFVEGLARSEIDDVDLSQFHLGVYGGDQLEDTSGIMRFCSIRYAGFGLEQDEEINGLTLGAVGNDSVIEFIEIWNQSDDCFEWFGGNVNMKYLASLFGGDDGYDKDQGYYGKIQFAIQIQDNTGDRDDDYLDQGVTDAETGRASRGGNVGEYDGPEGNSNTGRPYSVWEARNSTFIGKGPALGFTSSENDGPQFKSNAGGKLYNNIFIEFTSGGLIIDGSADPGRPDRNNLVGNAIQRLVWERSFWGPVGFGGDDDRANSADLLFRNNMWWDTGFVPTDGQRPGADDILLWLNHDDDDNGSPYSFGGPAGAKNEEPASNYFLDAADPSVLANFGESIAELPWFTTANDAAGADAGSFRDDHGNRLEDDPGVKSIYRLVNDGYDGVNPITQTDDGLPTLDPRLEVGAKARGAGTHNSAMPTDSFYTKVDFRGGFQDNLWLKGWTILDRAGDNPYAGLNVLADAPNPQVTGITITLDENSNPVISFDTEAGIQYSVEGSDDRNAFEPLEVVDGDDSVKSVTDTGSVVNSSSPRVYRVIPL